MLRGNLSFVHYSGGFLLWVSSLPSFTRHLRSQSTFKGDTLGYIYFNIVLLIHCICLTVIVVSEEIPNLYYFAGGEIIYRIFSVIILIKLIIQVDPENPGNPPVLATDRDNESSKMVTCANKPQCAAKAPQKLILVLLRLHQFSLVHNKSLFHNYTYMQYL